LYLCRKEYNNRKIILGVDELDVVKGTLLKGTEANINKRIKV